MNVDLNCKLMLQNAKTMARLDTEAQKRTNKFTASLLNPNELIERANGQKEKVNEIIKNWDSMQKPIVIERDGEIVGITRCAVNNRHLKIFENHTLDGLNYEQYNKLLYEHLPTIALENNLASFGKD